METSVRRQHECIKSQYKLPQNDILSIIPKISEMNLFDFNSLSFLSVAILFLRINCKGSPQPPARIIKRHLQRLRGTNISVAGGAGAPGDERDPVHLTVVLVTTPRLQTLPQTTGRCASDATAVLLQS